MIGLMAFLVIEASLARAQCNPVCASQPAACCGIQSDTFLAEECTGATSSLIHFVVPGANIGWVDLRSPATFDVSGTSGSVTLGDVMPVTFQFTIGDSAQNARFQIIDATLSVIGQCVATSGNSYSGLPSLISQQGRALQVSGRNPLYCRFTPAGKSTTDLLCFGVKGQVGGPFQSGQMCDADRVEFVCGSVL